MFFNALSAFVGSDDVHDEKDYLTSIEYEEKIMAMVGMTRDQDYKIYDVDLPKTGGHIHTLEAGFKNSQTLVLVHGYAASAVFYFKVISLLKDHFHIYAIDMYGLGSSARPKFEDFDFEKTVAFFVDPLEEWLHTLQLADVLLMGHSMGGYVCSQLFLRKKPSVKCLYLLSPAGFTNKTDEELAKEP